MKVCDKHRDREAIDTLIVNNDGTQLDVCEKCKEAILHFFSEPDAKLKAGLLSKVFGKHE